MYKEDLDKNTGAWVEEFFSWDRERQARLFRRLVRKGFAAKFNTAEKKEAVKGKTLSLSEIETDKDAKTEKALEKLKARYKEFGFTPRQAPALVSEASAAVRDRFLEWASQQSFLHPGEAAEAKAEEAAEAKPNNKPKAKK